MRLRSEDRDLNAIPKVWASFYKLGGMDGGFYASEWSVLYLRESILYISSIVYIFYIYLFIYSVYILIIYRDSCLLHMEYIYVYIYAMEYYLVIKNIYISQHREYNQYFITINGI